MNIFPSQRVETWLSPTSFDSLPIHEIEPVSYFGESGEFLGGDGQWHDVFSEEPEQNPLLKKQSQKRAPFSYTIMNFYYYKETRYLYALANRFLINIKPS